MDIHDFYRFIDPSGQILQLCDQINRQGSRSEQTAQITNLPGPTSSGFVTNNPQTHNINPGFQPSFQSPQQPQVQQQPQPQPFASIYFDIPISYLHDHSTLMFRFDCNILPIYLKYKLCTILFFCSATNFLSIKPGMYFTTARAPANVNGTKSICTAAVCRLSYK